MAQLLSKVSLPCAAGLALRGVALIHQPPLTTAPLSANAPASSALTWRCSLAPTGAMGIGRSNAPNSLPCRTGSSSCLTVPAANSRSTVHRLAVVQVWGVRTATSPALMQPRSQPRTHGVWAAPTR